MQLLIENMNGEIAKEVLSWEYDKPYDFYNNELTDEAMKELLDGSYNALVNNNQELIGFFCTGNNAQVPVGKKLGVYSAKSIDMGLGMNPKYVGKGSGFEFCSFIMRYIEKNYQSTPIRLTVAKFNQRAIHLYEKLGFVKKDEFSTDFAEFMTMVKEFE
ncbi:GNAT family N-acetyltransferase [Solibacillus sp. R5-41]|uniref:GNAT family N-acetyltransferase n=1 Tax=Solibacillus sp. R5-41 TaxID=2048654 RepID=UPI000C127A46|nr:GNAT family N-acetyltransferase [Solibacillus sp. R5-41]ATP41395.1 GNAT family N-acetyltransferase [Solibacillus sp. R5-41]